MDPDSSVVQTDGDVSVKKDKKKKKKKDKDQERLDEWICYRINIMLRIKMVL